MEPMDLYADRTHTVTRRYQGPPPSYEACEELSLAQEEDEGDVWAGGGSGGDDGTIVMPIGELLALRRPPTTLSGAEPKPDRHFHLPRITHHGVAKIDAGGWTIAVGLTLATLVIFLG